MIDQRKALMLTDEAKTYDSMICSTQYSNLQGSMKTPMPLHENSTNAPCCW